MDELSEEDKVTVARARKIERFLSQPMHVAEVFTGLPGVFVQLADTVKGFKGLCAGLGVPWTGEAAGFLAASDRPGKGLETRRVAAEQPSNWSRQLSAAQVDEAVGVLSAFPARLFAPASVP